MNRRKLLKHLVILMFFIFIANFLILKLHWYSLIWYSDIIMHFLGGFWIGLFFIYVFSLKNTDFSTFSLLFRVFLISLAIGLLWEFYQFFLNTVSLTSFNLIDTVSDLFFDLLGSIASVFYFFKVIMLASINKVQLEE